MCSLCSVCCRSLSLFFSTSVTSTPLARLRLLNVPAIAPYVTGDENCIHFNGKRLEKSWLRKISQAQMITWVCHVDVQTSFDDRDDNERQRGGVIQERVHRTDTTCPTHFKFCLSRLTTLRTHRQQSSKCDS